MRFSITKNINCPKCNHHKTFLKHFYKFEGFNYKIKCCRCKHEIIVKIKEGKIINVK